MMYFSRENGRNSFDIYVAYRLSDTSWSEPVNLGAPVNTDGWEAQPAVSADGTPRSALLKFRCGADSVYVYTSGYASFAGERVPHGPVSVTGILLPGKVGGRRVYELKMRDLNDVQVD